MLAQDFSSPLVQLARQEPPVTFQESHLGPALLANAPAVSKPRIPPPIQTQRAPACARFEQIVRILDRPQAGDPRRDPQPGMGGMNGLAPAAKRSLSNGSRLPLRSTTTWFCGSRLSTSSPSSELDIPLLIPARRVDGQVLPLEFLRRGNGSSSGDSRGVSVSREISVISAEESASRSDSTAAIPAIPAPITTMRAVLPVCCRARLRHRRHLVHPPQSPLACVTLQYPLPVHALQVAHPTCTPRQTAPTSFCNATERACREQFSTDSRRPGSSSPSGGWRRARPRSHRENTHGRATGHRCPARGRQSASRLDRDAGCWSVEQEEPHQS